MSPSTKKTIMHALAGASVNASDDLYRAKRQFGRLGAIEMDQEYAGTGMTCRQLLHVAQRQVDEVTAAIIDVQALP